MKTETIDFDSWNEVKNCSELLQHNICECSFKQINQLGSKKSISKQLNPALRFVSIKDDKFHIKALISIDVLIMHKHSKIEDRIDTWHSNNLIEIPHDVLCLIGFEALEKTQHKLEVIENQMEELEEQILENPNRGQQLQIIKLRRKALHLKKQINDHVSVFNSIKQNTPLWHELITTVERELDNAKLIVELVENLRDAYQASIDNKSNDIMKFLTILATILLPINMLTSFFGMNFEFMPLIHNVYGMDALYAMIIVIVSIIIIGLKRMKWL